MGSNGPSCWNATHVTLTSYVTYSMTLIRWKAQQPPEAPSTPKPSSSGSVASSSFGASAQAADGTLVRGGGLMDPRGGCKE